MIEEIVSHGVTATVVPVTVTKAFTTFAVSVSPYQVVSSFLYLHCTMIAC